jgi:hypothetical protein
MSPKAPEFPVIKGTPELFSCFGKRYSEIKKAFFV